MNDKSLKKEDLNPEIIKRLFSDNFDLTQLTDPPLHDFKSYEDFQEDLKQNQFEKRIVVGNIDGSVSAEDRSALHHVLYKVFAELGFKQPKEKSPLKKSKSKSKKIDMNESKDTASSDSDDPKQIELFLEDGSLNTQKLNILFQKKGLRDFFLRETLRLIPPKTKLKLLEYTTLMKLKQVMQSVLTSMLSSLERDPQGFLEALFVLNGFVAKDPEGEQKVYLYSFFANSGVWKDMGMWKECYSIIQNEKMKEQGVRQTGQQQGMWKMFSNIQRMMNMRSPEEQAQIERVIKNDSLKNISIYLSHLNLSLGYSTEILSTIAKQQEVGTDVLVTLIDSLESNYHTRDMAKFNRSREDPKQLIQNWGEKLVPFRLALDFLGSPQDLLEVLLVNKEWNTRFNDLIYSRMLTQSGLLGVEQRKGLWQAILQPVSLIHNLRISVNRNISGKE